MGGMGSGSYYRMKNTRGTAENSLPLDIRRLKREGCLTFGREFSWQWLNGLGNPYASIGATVHGDYLTLQYTHKKTEDVSQKVYFTYTPCNYGGERIWFRCPSCGRRCAVIYGCGKFFACRVCCNLTYQTCNETPSDQLASKANKLRKRIGAKPGAFNSLPLFKPKYMHQTTWMKTRYKITRLEELVLDDLHRQLNGLRSELDSIKNKKPGPKGPVVEFFN